MLNDADLEKMECDQDAFGCLMLITVTLNNQSFFYNYSDPSMYQGTFEIEASS